MLLFFNYYDIILVNISNERMFFLETDKNSISINTYNHIVDQFIEYYLPQKIKNTITFKAETDYIANHLPKYANILDAGTAIGDYPKYLTEQYNKYFNVIGIDAAENMLKIAINNAPKAHFQLMDIRDMKFSNSSFDAIICFATLIHFDDTTCVKILDKFNDLLKPGGIIGINVMEHKNNEKELFIPEVFDNNFMQYFNRYSKQFFIDYFTNNNYKIEKIFNNNELVEEKAGKDLAGNNEFTIVAKKK